MRRTQPLPPGPAESAWLQVWRYFRDPNAFFAQCQRDYGDAFTMRYPGNPALVVFSHPTAVKEILTSDPDDLRAGEANVILRNVVGDDSLFVLDGARHDHHRRAMTPLFHGDRLRAHAAPMTKAAAQAVHALPRNVPFRAQPWLESTTLDMIVGALFADSPKRVLEQLRHAILKFTQLATSPMGTLAAMLVPVEAVRQMTRLIRTRIQLGGRTMTPFALLPGGRLVRAQRAQRQLVLDELARRRRAATPANGDIVSLLMAAPDDRGQLPSDEQLHDHILTLILAGNETSATTLAWAVHHLSEYADLQSELRAELASSRGDLNACARLDAVLKETLRLTPVVPIIPRRLARSRSIGGYSLPAGTVVAVAPFLTQHRDDIWTNPRRFDPTRFIDTRIDSYHFFPFGGGARRCLGMTFSLYQMKTVLAEMVRCTCWRKANSDSGGEKRRGVLVSPSRGVPIIAVDVARLH